MNGALRHKTEIEQFWAIDSMHILDTKSHDVYQITVHWINWIVSNIWRSQGLVFELYDHQVKGAACEPFFSGANNLLVCYKCQGSSGDIYKFRFCLTKNGYENKKIEH